MFSNIGEAIDAIVQFDRAKFSAMPEHVQAEMNLLASVGVSPVDRIVRTGEILFANRDKLTRNADREMTARLVEFAGVNGWHGLNENNRAAKISAVMMASAGGRSVADADVPTPREEFVAKPMDATSTTPPSPRP